MTMHKVISDRGGILWLGAYQRGERVAVPPWSWTPSGCQWTAARFVVHSAEYLG